MTRNGEVNGVSQTNSNGNHSPHLKHSEQLIIKPCSQNGQRKREWNVKPTKFASKTYNSIRDVVENSTVKPNPDKTLIPLSIGDPTVFGNLEAANETIQAVMNSVKSGKFNGYARLAGSVSAREAVSKYVSPHQGAVTPDDVILSSGCASALDMCISVLAGPGQNILMACPIYPNYKTLAFGFDIELRTYNLLPGRQWEIDLDHLEQLIDAKTAAVIITNPSNPCGSVFGKKHLLDVIAVCEKYCVPIIADEIYELMVFPDIQFHSVGSLSKNVPVLSCSGIAKRFLVPGWRLGWIIIHDRNNIFKDLRKALINLCGRIMGSNTLIQGALPEILEKTPQTFFDNVNMTIYKHAKLAYDMLTNVDGLRPIMPSGAMYMLIGIEIEHFPEFADEMEFFEGLIREQSVFCLPGRCFDYPNYMRIVLSVPEHLIIESCRRMAEFCEKYFKKSISD